MPSSEHLPRTRHRLPSRRVFALPGRHALLNWTNWTNWTGLDRTIALYKRAFYSWYGLLVPAVSELVKSLTQALDLQRLGVAIFGSSVALGFCGVPSLGFAFI